MLWQQMKGILSWQSVRDVRQSKNFWKVLGQTVQPKSQWARQAICARHALNPQIFFLSQYWPMPWKTTEQTEILNPEWYILVHLRMQLSCRVLTLTLQSKGHVLTSTTSCYQPSFEATIQLTNFLWFIVHFVVIHSLDYCEVMQDSQLELVLDLYENWRSCVVLKLCCPLYSIREKYSQSAAGMTTAILNGSCTSGCAGLH